MIRDTLSILLFLACICGFVAGCLTPAQHQAGLDRIARGQADLSAAILEADQLYRDGTITLADRMRLIQEANEELGEEVKGTLDQWQADVVANKDQAVAVVTNDGEGWSQSEVVATALGGVLGLLGLGKGAQSIAARQAAAAAKAMSEERDRRRVALGSAYIPGQEVNA